MNLQNIGSFLTYLRKEQGLTQEQLGEKLGVSNKTVSRWENGNYLPPVEMLQQLAELYGVTINELLSGQRLDEGQFREKAEENICDTLGQQGFTFRQRICACGEWLRRYWWAFFLFILPAVFVFSRLHHAIDGEEKLVVMGTTIIALGLVVIGNHLIFHASLRAHETTGKSEEFHAFRTIRTLWLMALFVLLFIIYDLLLSFLFALTPEGSCDGYRIISRFYDILFEGSGDMIHNLWMALNKTLQFTLIIVLINLDMTILWMKRK